MAASRVKSTFLVLIFAFALAFMSTFVLALIVAFLSSFRGKVLTFLECNRGERSILLPCGIIPFEPLAGLLSLPMVF